MQGHKGFSGAQQVFIHFRFYRCWLGLPPLLAAMTPAVSQAGLPLQAEVTYVFVGGLEESNDVTRRIEGVVLLMNRFFGAIARRQLPRVCKVPPRVAFVRRQDELTIDLPPWPPRTTPIDNSPRTFRTSTGKRVRFRRVLRGNTIRETATVGRSRRVLVYSFSDDATRLRLHWRVEYPGVLPEAVTYALSYRRRGA
jgi:hypothetical protein